MDLRKIVAVIGAVLLFGFAICPVISGEVSLVGFWKIIVAILITSGIALLFWGWKPDLEKPRLKIKPVVKTQVTNSNEEIKIASIIVINNVYLGKEEARNCRIELKIKDLWKRFETPSLKPVDIKAHHNHTFPICQMFKNKDSAEIFMGSIPQGTDFPFPTRLEKDHIYEVLVKLHRESQDTEKIYHLKLNTSWENFDLKLDC